VNGLDGLAITKLDVLTGIPELQICVQYSTSEGTLDEIPTSDLGSAKPIYETLKGWSQPIGNARSLSDLPKEAQDYVRFIERQCGVPAWIVSVGFRRDETVVVQDPW
jgi:adenylosuccinate synthase